MTERSEAPVTRREVTGWGRTAPTGANVVAPLTIGELARSAASAGPRGTIARGLGRSYGDAAQNAGGRVVDTTSVSDVLAFDHESGVITASAGASFDKLMRLLVPRGWFVPVTPGTRFVTVGGAVASDIHGKNHHRAGTWCAHVDRLTLATPAAGPVSVGPGEDAELFWATAGGLGLTGTIVDATVRLAPIETSRALVDTDRTDDLDECMAVLSDGGDDAYEYTVAWLDLLPARGGLGRSVITRGRFARVDELDVRRRRDPLAYDPQRLFTVPPFVPFGLLTRRRIQAFNEAWFRRAPRHRRGEVQTISRFFHPLDGIGDWNLVYGPRGFLQWQILVPFGAEDTLRAVAREFQDQVAPTVIGVLKRFGRANPGPLSFPHPGWTLSLDMPAAIEGLPGMLDRLDEMVADAGGRIYLTKDGRLRPDLLPRMYPRLDQWRQVRERVDPTGVLRSDLGRRLGLC